MAGNAVVERVTHAVFAQPDEVQERVLLAVHSDFENVKGIAGGFALYPQPISGQAPEGRHTFEERVLQRHSVGVSEHQDVARFDVLRNHGYHTIPTGREKSPEIHDEFVTTSKEGRLKKAPRRFTHPKHSTTSFRSLLVSTARWRSYAAGQQTIEGLEDTLRQQKCAF